MSKLISKKEDQKEEWDEIWEDKRLVNRLVNFGRKIYNKRWLMLLKPYLGVKEFAELGCGTSSFLALVSKKADKVIGIDYSDQALKVSKKKFKDLGIKNAEFFNDNVMKLKTKRKFDTVWSQGLVEHFDNPGKIVKAHLQLTKKGGHAVMSGPYKYSYHYLWYKVTRPKLLRRFWPWTEQNFWTKKSFVEALLKENSKETDYKVKITWFFGVILLIVKKK